MSFHPYLHFKGNAREALTFYARVFGADDLQLMTFADAPPDFAPDGALGLILHGQFSTGPGQTLMGCDVPEQWGWTEGRGAIIYHEAADAAAAHRVFDALATGGSVTMALAPTFWSPLYGMVLDRFGTSWMVSIPDA